MNPLIHRPCRIELFGGLRVQQGERAITRFHTYKTGALLACLAFQYHRPQPREALIEMLWPDGTLERGRNNLSIALSSLRSQLEPPGTPAGAVLVADRLTVGLNPTAVTTDVAEFETALQTAMATQSEMERAVLLRQALALYRGELLPGYYEAWIVPERQRLLEGYLQAIRRLVRHLARRRDFATALDLAQRALNAEPLREEAHRDLLRLYVAAGQPSAALQHYQYLEQTLQQLYEKPSPATRRLLHEIETRMQAAPEQTAPTRMHITPPVRQPLTASSPLPTGTITFLLTDIAGSMALGERTGDAFKSALATHHALLRAQFPRQNGYEVKEVGDAFLVAFERAGDALQCAVACQRALAGQVWPADVGNLLVRMALHTGEVELADGDYHGLTLHRASRLLIAAHGGQLLCSEETAALLRRDLEVGVRLTDLGVYHLHDLPTPERLFQVEYPDMPRRQFPAPQADAGYTSALPLALTRFFGREIEQARLQEMLRTEDIRLVTLTGPGGTGKTRLALEVARGLLELFAGAVWFVPLGDVVDAGRIAGAIADSMKLERTPHQTPFEQIAEALSHQPSLLILDNFEQLAAQGNESVQTLLTRVPTLTCLITSRQLLRLSGERAFVLKPLPVPDRAEQPERLCLFESVQLFLDRAQTVKPDFQVTGNNAAAVAALCQKLEGIPLAIELAAARAQVLTPLQMLAQLENRFEFLASRRRDAIERHKTLRAAMEWSYRLLSPELQRFFAGLSLFRGGWTAEAAEAVCDEPLALDYLAQLREASLVLAEEWESAGGMRFRMLETVREYAWEELTEEEPAVLSGRHLDYFLHLAEEAEPKLSGPEQIFSWFERLETEHANLHAALQFCMQETNKPPDPPHARPEEAGLRFCAALTLFWFRCGHLSEGRQWYTTALAQAEGLRRTKARAKALNGAGKLARDQGDYATARDYHAESLAITREVGDQQGVALSLDNLGLIALFQNDYATAQAYFEEGLTTAREIEDRGSIIDALSHLGTVASNQGGYATAQACYEESLAIAREVGEQVSTSGLLNNLGLVASHQGDYAAARTLLEESLAIKRELGDQGDAASVLDNLGVLAREQGDYAMAQAYHEESLAILREISGRKGTSGGLHCLGLVAAYQGDYTSARALLEESLAIKREFGDRVNLPSLLDSLGIVASHQGDDAAARAYLEESLAIRRELGDRRGPVAVQEGFAGMASIQRQPER